MRSTAACSTSCTIRLVRACGLSASFFESGLDAFAMSVTQLSQELLPPAKLQLNQATLEVIIQGVAAAWLLADASEGWGEGLASPDRASLGLYGEDR